MEKKNVTVTVQVGYERNYKESRSFEEREFLLKFSAGPENTDERRKSLLLLSAAFNVNGGAA